MKDNNGKNEKLSKARKLTGKAKAAINMLLLQKKNQKAQTAAAKPTVSAAKEAKIKEYMPEKHVITSNGNHEEVIRSKYYSTHQPHEVFNEEHFMFPGGYGENKIVLLVRDPHWLHSYWEVTNEAIDHIRQIAKENNLGRNNLVLRVKDVTGVHPDAPNSFYDIHISDNSSNWYINIPSDNRTYCVEVGILTPGGKFYMIARSNFVTAPRAGVSDIYDEEWMSLEDYDRIYALSGGLRNLAASSAELRKIVQESFSSELSSGALSSMGSGSVGGQMHKKRDFFLIVDAELIVYGRTVPTAQLTIQGRPKKLNPDGTFSARFALPVGRHEIPVTSVSSDGIDKITITPIVEREKNR